MTVHKLKLTENELSMVRWAVEKTLQSIEYDMTPWSELDEEPPEYLQELFAEVSLLYNKLPDPARHDTQRRKDN